MSNLQRDHQIFWFSEILQTHFPYQILIKIKIVKKPKKNLPIVLTFPLNKYACPYYQSHFIK